MSKNGCKYRSVIIMKTVIIEVDYTKYGLSKSYRNYFTGLTQANAAQELNIHKLSSENEDIRFKISKDIMDSSFKKKKPENRSSYESKRFVRIFT